MPVKSSSPLDAAQFAWEIKLFGGRVVNILVASGPGGMSDEKQFAVHAFCLVLFMSSGVAAKSVSRVLLRENVSHTHRDQLINKLRNTHLCPGCYTIREKMKTKAFLIMFGLALIFGGATRSSAQVKRVQMHIAGYLCGN